MRPAVRLMLATVAGMTLLMTGCKWDDDDAFAPYTRAIFLETADTLTGALSLTRLTDSTLTEHWNMIAGVDDINYRGFFSGSDAIWLADSGDNRLVKSDPLTGKSLDAYATTLRPDHFAVGKTYIAVTDSVQGKIAFIHLKNRMQYTTSLSGAGGRVMYHSGKFWVNEGCCQIGVWSEDAMARIALHNVTDTVTEMQFDENNILYFSQWTGTAFRLSSIDFNSNLYNPGPAVNFSLIRFSPWMRVQYGHEYMQDLYLTGGSVNAAGVPAPVDHFECDFFEGNLYWFRNDSVGIHCLTGHTDKWTRPFTGRVKRAGFIIGSAG